MSCFYVMLNMIAITQNMVHRHCKSCVFAGKAHDNLLFSSIYT